MLSGVGLEVMNPTNAEFKWQTVTKRRRSKKSIARSLNGVPKFDKTSPKRVGDFYESDCSKFNEAVLGELTSDKTEHVPIKKKRHLLQSPSSQRNSSSPLSEGFDDGLLCKVTKDNYNSAGDFSGIELLAAAATMDDDSDDKSKEGFVPEDSSMPKSSDSSTLARGSKIDSKCNASGNFLDNATGHANDTECSLALKDVKVDRRHWDLNTVMDSWDEPFEVSIDGNSSKNDSNLEIEENKLKAVSPDGACNVSPNIQESLRESANDYVLNAAREAFDQNADEKNSDHVLETPSQVLNTDAKDFRKTYEHCGDMTSLRETNYSVDNSNEVKLFNSPSKSSSFLAVGTTYVQDDQSVVIDNAKVSEHLKPAEPAVKNDDDDLQNQESRMIKFNDNTASFGKIYSAIDTCRDSKISQEKNGCDSPYEDGELRGSFLPSLEENELEDERVDYESDAADYLGFEQMDEEGSKGSNGDVSNIEIYGKNESNTGSGTTVEQSMETVNEANEDGMKTHFFYQSDGKVSRIDKDASEGKQFCIERQSTDGKGLLFIHQYRPHRLGGSYSRPEKYPFRYRTTAQVTERGGVDQCTYLSSRDHYDPNFPKIEGRTYTKPRYINSNYESKDFHRPFVRRPHFDRNESISVHRRMPLTRENSSLGRVNYSCSAGTDFEEDFEPLLSKRRSRSRSRTRSPMAWQPHRERLGTKRHNNSPDFKFESKMERLRVPFSKSPDFRSEVKMDRVRVPFSKPKFASDHGRDYSSPRSNGRWEDGRTFGYDRLKHTQRFYDDGFSGQSKSDEYFRPIIRPGRFSIRGGDDKFETNYKYTRREDRGEVMHRGRVCDGNLRGGEDKRV